MPRKLFAKDVMTPDPITVRAEQSVGELVGVFHHYQISGAPVRDDEGQLVGVVSLRDVAFTALRPVGRKEDGPMSGYHVHGKIDRARPPVPFEWHLAPDLTVADIMTPVVFTVRADSSVAEVAETMNKGRVHRLVVVDEEESVIGIVTSGDLLEVVRGKEPAASST